MTEDLPFSYGNGGIEMSDPKNTAKSAKERAKAEKKKAKAELKARKKAAAPQTDRGAKDSIAPTSSSGLSAAERSAAAAEAQLQIRRRQMWISLLGVFVAAATMMFTISRCRVIPTAQTEDEKSSRESDASHQPDAAPS